MCVASSNFQRIDTLIAALGVSARMLDVKPFDAKR